MKRWSVVLVAVAVGLSACSSSTKAATPNTSATTVAAAAATTVQANLSPYKVVFLGQSAAIGEDDHQGQLAAIKYINGHGGLKGHPIVETTCVDNNDANQATTCANNAVNDPDVLAVVGQYSNQGAVIDPILEKAGLASIGGLPFTAADNKSPVFFPATIGILVGLGGAAAITDLLHGTKVGLAYADVPAGATFAGTINGAVLKPRNAKLASSVGIPQTAADLSSQVQAVNQGNPDGIVLLVGAVQAASFIKTARQLNIQTPIFIPGGIETDSVVQQQLGSAATNLYFYSSVARQGANYDAFLTQIKDSDKNWTNDADDNAVVGWLAVKMFADTVSNVATVNRAAVLSAMNGLSGYDTGGLTPPLDFTKSGTALAGNLPRIVNTSTTLNYWHDGKIEPYPGSTFVDPFSRPGAAANSTTTAKS